MIKFKEKTKWYYISEDIDNSFEFFLSKIKDQEAIIITNKDTPEMNIFKVKISELKKEYERKKIFELKKD